MKNYFKNKSCSTFDSKSKKVKALINESLVILDALGLPLNNTPRRLERMALSFLAVVGMDANKKWNQVKDLKDSRSMKTRDIINYINKEFNENISSGSYDDIRRKDLKLLVLSEVIIPTQPNSARNDSTRGYALNPDFSEIIKIYNSKGWAIKVEKFMNEKIKLSELMLDSRAIDKIPVKLSTGKTLNFFPGKHNVLQKLIIEEFLTRYGFESEVLYVGDTSDKYLLLDNEKLKELQFFEIGHGELPDVIAYSSKKNWLYLIEAVHSSGPISVARMLHFKKLTSKCKAEIIYVTAFLDKTTFRRFAPEIAWESEVWIANEPDHLIHFNGDKFLGPYVK